VSDWHQVFDGIQPFARCLEVAVAVDHCGCENLDGKKWRHLLVLSLYTRSSDSMVALVIASTIAGEKSSFLENCVFRLYPSKDIGTG